MTKINRIKRIAEGWRWIGWIVPPDVHAKVTAYKNALMKDYRNEKPKTPRN